MSGLEWALGRDLPGAWADLSSGITRRQVENILQFDRGVTIFFDEKPVAVIVSVDRYRSCSCPDHMRDHS